MDKSQFNPSYIYSKIKVLDRDKTQHTPTDSELMAVAAQKFGLSKVRQPDILYMEDVLVSEGQNLNDDIFLAEELNAAVLKRDTVKGKPVNWEHSPAEIIGVMYDSFLIDDTGNKIDKITEGQKFHVVSRSMIWKNISEKHRERAQAIALAAQDSSLYVSMEAFFGRFDYAVGNDIVERNENTAFLDLALKVNGGPGQFDNKSVRRILRDITFGGKAVVAIPANPESFILSVASNIDEMKNKNIPKENIIGKMDDIAINLDGVGTRCEDTSGSQDNNDVVVFDEALDNVLAVASNSDTNDKGDTMSDTILKDLTDKLAAVEATNQELKDQLANNDMAKAEEVISELKEKVEKHLATISDLEAKDSESDKMGEELEKAKDDLSKSEASIKELEEKIQNFEAEARLASRKAAIEEVITLDEEALASELSAIKLYSDEEFAAYIERCKLFVSTAKDVLSADDNTDGNDTDTAGAADAAADGSDNNSIADAVDGIQPDADVSLNISDGDEYDANVQKLADVFSGNGG